MSARNRERNVKKLDALKASAKASGASASSSASDITPFLFLPLEPGADNRGYTSQQARNSINSTIEASRQTFSSLQASNLPGTALAMHAQAQKSGQSTSWVSTRSAHDSFSSGEDHTYTRNTGGSHAGMRTASDTPRPRSPRPEDHGASLTPTLRSEHAHQDPFQFTGAPGHTVHAPTQANQVADTSMERFVAPHPGAFIHREDTPTHSTLHAARPVGRRWETQSVSYQRRILPSARPSSSSTPSAPSASSSSASSPHTPTGGGGKPKGGGRKKKGT